MRDLIQETVDRDEPIPEKLYTQWEKWRNSFCHLQDLQISILYLQQSMSEKTNKTVHVFSDASESTISAVAYIESDGNFGLFLESQNLHL
jgi:hypothetical protein